MIAKNLNLLQLNNYVYIKEDVIDLKCRSMRDNLLFVGITEVVDTEQPSIGRSLIALDGTQDVSSDIPYAAKGTTTSGRFRTEDCGSKVIRFCRVTLTDFGPRKCDSD
ncbi:hypothetical protein DPMN_161425 [Dreissena polymorpha]|uniref:Uncharacterized protein n=1 Tax=Dreissena polymorpha TaxID=45954 RepID=A0A9D4ISP0_DREPO|nr:hypothetical protein DPMN_161423 [Dreissena polymorpha]KAH3783487.1 hypothetical protein DPMN_161425 [Dreissena polymorpha]